MGSREAEEAFETKAASAAWLETAEVTSAVTMGTVGTVSGYVVAASTTGGEVAIALASAFAMVATERVAAEMITVIEVTAVPMATVAPLSAGSTYW